MTLELVTTLRNTLKLIVSRLDIFPSINYDANCFTFYVILQFIVLRVR